MSQNQESSTGICSIRDTPVRLAMTAPFITVPANADIEDALNLMIDNKISGLPVLEFDGRLAGVLTEYDVLWFFHESKSAFHPFRPCRDFMSTAMVTVAADASLDDANKILIKTSVRRLLVIENELCVGVLSRRDVVRFIRDDRAAQSHLPWTPPEDC